ncbi:MAG: hypothetical protein WCF61_04610 [Terriglobales bacterium]
MFHWEDDFTPPLWSFPEPAIYYMMCRHAIAALCAAQPNRPVLWLPTFFCPEVARFCGNVALIREYRDDCRWPEPDWKSLQPAPNDLVLAVNYFGVRSIEPWRDWMGRHGCILVEDHTQDPFSAWALESVASYAVCSLRKTLPVPDGAMLWSPLGLPLPAEPAAGDWRGSVLKFGAMLYKRHYLEGTVAANTKLRFREWQLKGERELSEAPLCAISPISQAMLSSGVPKRWRERRVENAGLLLQALASWDFAKPTFREWPDGHAPFDVPFVFPSRSERDHCQHFLQQHEIFCPVEWPCDTPDTVAIDLSSRILSFPIDHRYTRGDIERIATAVLAAQNSQAVSEGALEY